MDKRQQQLKELRNFTESADAEITMILQNLQWDRQTLLQKPKTVCKFNKHHSIPAEVAEIHEKECFYKYLGYSKDDEFLPDADENAFNAIKLSHNDINKIIHEASMQDPSFRKVMTYLNPEFDQCLGVPNTESEPMTLARLQCTYTADERRAIHNAVIKACPATVDPFNLEIINKDGSQLSNSESQKKSRLELEAELRDIKRRRARYRGACPEKNYSHVLRGLIETQMETLSSQIQRQKRGDSERKISKDENSYLECKSTRSEKKSKRYEIKHASCNGDSISYDKERKRKHESVYHRREQEHRHKDSITNDSKHRHAKRAEKYEIDNSRSRNLHSSSSRYEVESKYSSYDRHRDRKPRQRDRDDRRHKDRDSKYY